MRFIHQIQQFVTGTGFWVLAALVGLVSGEAVSWFRKAIQYLEGVYYGAEGERVVSAAINLDWKVALLAPIIGGCIVSVLLLIGQLIGWGKYPRPASVVDVIASRRRKGGTRQAVFSGESRLTVKDGVLNLAICTVSLGAGASTGREGPAVHLGAVIASLPAKIFRLSGDKTRALLGCGAAAAVSASFHAPLAGVLFAHEVVLGRYRNTDIGPVAASSIMASLVARRHFGDEAIFPTPNLPEASYEFFAVTPLMGLFAAALAIFIIRSWVIAPQYGQAFADSMNIPVWALPPIGGAALGALAIAFPQILGVGYEATGTALQGGYDMSFLLILLLAKFAATTLCLGCRFGGGVFSPAIFIGAMAGGFFGAIIGAFTGDPQAATLFFALVGLGAVSGAVLGAPISTTLIAFELTGSYGTAAAVLLSVSLATMLVQAVEGGGAFAKQLKALQA